MITDLELMAFIDGELDPLRAEEVARAIAANPALARRAARLGAVGDILVRAFAAETSSPPAPALTAALTRPRRASARQAWPAAAAMAAGLAGVVFGMALPDAPGAASARVALADGLTPGPVLAAALDEAPSESARVAGVWRVTLRTSLRAEDGRLCRAFDATGQGSTVAGAACLEPQGWRLVALAPGPKAADGFTLADGGEPPPVAAALDALGAQTPLSAEAEAALIAARWRERS